MSCTSVIVSGAASLGVFLGLLLTVFFTVLTALRWIRNFPTTKCHWVDEWKKEKRNSSTVSPDTVQVREFIENLVEKLIGGSLDGITVGKLSTHSSYLAIFEKYHGLLCGELAKLGFTLHLSTLRSDVSQKESSDSVKLSLSRLIERIIREAVALPNIREILRRSASSQGSAKNSECEKDGFEGKTYEDILATAILNKVIENIQNGKRENEGNTSGTDGDVYGKFEQFLEDETFDSEGGWTSSQPFSLTIEEHVEEVTTTFDASDDGGNDDDDSPLTFQHRTVPFPESGKLLVDAAVDERNPNEEDDAPSATELLSSANSWEENWLFQKRRARSTPNVHHPVPVPMLVPNPSQHFRALVGGVDADDLSDSDHLEAFMEEAHLPATEVNVRPTEAEPPGSSAMTVNSAEIAAETTSLEDPLRSFDRNSGLEFPPETECRIHEGTPTTQVDSHSSKPPFRWAIAEREKDKWKNPVPMAVNPYSPEGLSNRPQQKRNQFLRLRSFLKVPEDTTREKSTENKFYIGEDEKARISRDYYVNVNANDRKNSDPSEVSYSVFQKKVQEKRDNTKKEDKAQGVLERAAMDQKQEKGGTEIRSRFRLPNVKELAKHFVPTEGQPPEISRKTLEKEPELDYSSVPVAEIILNLSNILNATCHQEGQKDCFSDGNEGRKEKPRGRLETIRFNGKGVHSLTARSISKEFRQGLKNGSPIRVPKNGGESLACHKGSSSPPPSVDLKNMKKFWEEMITANSGCPK